MRIQFVCLANSTKLGGRCIAGIRTDGGGWIRPVSRGPSGTLKPNHYKLDNGFECDLLDLVEIEVSETSSQPHQPENYVLENTQWRLIRRLQPREAVEFIESFLVTGPDLLGNSSDRLDYQALESNPVSASLVVIEPTHVSWDFNVNPWGRIQRRTEFRHGGRLYDLSVSDPEWRKRMSQLPHGTYGRDAFGLSLDDRVFYTISLTEPFYQNNPAGECYKLVAAVVVLPK